MDTLNNIYGHPKSFCFKTYSIHPCTDLVAVLMDIKVQLIFLPLNSLETIISFKNLSTFKDNNKTKLEPSREVRIYRPCQMLIEET